MTGDTGTTDVGARLRALVLAGDLEALGSYVDALTGSDLTAARRWVTGTHDLDGYPYPEELGDRAHRGTYAAVQRMRLARLVTWARLGAPVATVKAFSAELTHLTDEQLREVVPSVVDRDRAWAEAFATAADAVRPSARGSGTVRLLLDAVVRAHGLPVPRGRLFHEGWIREVRGQVEPSRWTDHEPTLDHLLADSLLPDVVYLQLASGEVGGWPAFGQVLPTLVAKGLIDRDRTLTVALEQLTAGQKPSAQKALAGVLTALEVRADEVPGGLDLLLSILSSSHDSAVAPVLDLAIGSVQTEEDVVELARVVAPRAQKNVRRTLLKALAPDALGTRVDHAALLEAVELLADSDDDVSTRARYDAARTALGGTTRAEPQAPVALGLWDLRPREPVDRETARWANNLWLRERTRSCLSVRNPRSAREWVDEMVDEMLDAAAVGDITDGLVATVQEVGLEGALSPVRAVALLEPLFLGGAMRSAWPVALEVVALCAERPRTVAGLDRLLGLLATYAVEVPRPVELPAAVARLAAGRSKTALEAQRLLALTGATTSPDSDPPRPLGLWREGSEPGPWELAHPPTRDLDSIGQRIVDSPHGHRVSSAVRRQVLSSLLLDELGALVAEHGVEVVRERVAAAQVPFSPSARSEAVQFWARGLLTTESYWSIARSTRTVDDLAEGWRAELGSSEAHTKARSWTLADAVQHDPPVMPAWWSDRWLTALLRFQFLHTCEVLLVLERGGRVVSSPDVVDGSLGLARLWERLASAPLVGPLDLRLALGRLRPDLRHLRPPGAGATIDGSLAGTVGPPEQAYDVVERWVAEGGLRLTPQPGVGRGAWHYSGTCAVPWRSLVALADLGVDDGPAWHPWGDSEVLPGRVDLCLRHGVDPRESPADVGGALGVTAWRTLLDALGDPSSNAIQHPTFTFLVRLQDQGRLDPAVAAAAAVQRWDEGVPDPAGALGWERAMLRGALRGLWPVAVAVVEAGLARGERPADLDALVEVLRRRTHEVPPEHVPAFLAGA
ncbi:hypothetical protein [Nocardioides zeicaulis]|uniref:Secreted protein n=1 Tax=Nocardioides zeicaulis TaxID=1776857 RepID=A0ABV6E053_9ACTN